jgi:hypothetical protein
MGVRGPVEAVITDSESNMGVSTDGGINEVAGLSGTGVKGGLEETCFFLMGVGFNLSSSINNPRH